MEMNFAGIIFDCDGVLVDSERIHIAVERALLAEMGLEYDLADYQTRFVGLPDKVFVAELESDFAKLNRGAMPADFEERVHAIVWERFENELHAIPGLTTLLDKLDVPIAVASSSRLVSLHKKLHLTGLHAAFDPHVYSGEQVTHGKPAPDLFLFAAEQLGCDPEACLVVEDSVNGVRAGVVAGMQVWGFAGGGHADAGLQERLARAGAHRVFANYADMLSSV